MAAKTARSLNGLIRPQITNEATTRLAPLIQAADCQYPPSPA